MTFAKFFSNAVWGGLLVLLVVAAGSGCVSSDPVPPPPQPGVTGPGVESPTYTDKLSPGNKITINFSETSNPPLPHEETIREDGMITPPLVGAVKATGKSTGELQSELLALYVPKYFKRLTVTVTSEARFFTVDGEVRAAGLQTYIGEMTALKGISSAGGFTDFAKKSKVHVIRPGRDKPIIVDCDKGQRDPKYDIPIYPGDRIYVPRRIW